MSVLVVGSVALDNVRTPYGEVKESLGGSCCYASVAASYFAPTAIVGVVGGDFPKRHLALLDRHGIDRQGLQIDKAGRTFRWTGYYEYEMSQAHTLNTELNVFAEFRPEIPEALRRSEFLLLGNIDPDLQLEVLRQMKRPRLVLIDTMNFWIGGKREALLRVMKQCDVALLNDAEARQLCDTPSLHKAAKRLLQMGLKRVVIKKGENGCLVVSKSDVFTAPAYLLEVIRDPTGAGDTFAGGFIGYLAGAKRLDDATFRKAVVVGTAMASFTVEDFSLKRLDRLEMSEIQERCARVRAQAEIPAVRLPVRRKPVLG
jgi:sugar/nucleoside kinase (ribokinase family)